MQVSTKRIIASVAALSLMAGSVSSILPQNAFSFGNNAIIASAADATAQQVAQINEVLGILKNTTNVNAVYTYDTSRQDYGQTVVGFYKGGSVSEENKLTSFIPDGDIVAAFEEGAIAVTGFGETDATVNLKFDTEELEAAGLVQAAFTAFGESYESDATQVVTYLATLTGVLTTHTTGALGFIAACKGVEAMGDAGATLAETYNLSAINGKTASFEIDKIADVTLATPLEVSASLSFTTTRAGGATGAFSDGNADTYAASTITGTSAIASAAIDINLGYDSAEDGVDVTANAEADPTRSGYILEGYYSDSTYTATNYLGDTLADIYVAEANTVIYAKWTEKATTAISYTGTIADITAGEDVTVDLTPSVKIGDVAVEGAVITAVYTIGGETQTPAITADDQGAFKFPATTAGDYVVTFSYAETDANKAATLEVTYTVAAAKTATAITCADPDAGETTLTTESEVVLTPSVMAGDTEVEEANITAEYKIGEGEYQELTGADGVFAVDVADGGVGTYTVKFSYGGDGTYAAATDFEVTFIVGEAEEESDDATLASVTLNGTSLSTDVITTAIKTADDDYTFGTFEAAFDAENITLSAAATDLNITEINSFTQDGSWNDLQPPYPTGNQNTAGNTLTDVVFPFTGDTMYLTIQVKAEDGSSTITYQFEITRGEDEGGGGGEVASNDATLSAITVGTTALTEENIAEAEASYYNIVVPYDTASVPFSVTATSSKISRINAYPQHAGPTNWDMIENSGQIWTTDQTGTATYLFDSSLNAIQIVVEVTAEDGTTDEKYVVRITRDLPVPTITVGDYEATQHVNASATPLALTPVLTARGATITGDITVSLNGGAAIAVDGTYSLDISTEGTQTVVFTYAGLADNYKATTATFEFIVMPEGTEIVDTAINVTGYTAAVDEGTAVTLSPTVYEVGDADKTPITAIDEDLITATIDGVAATLNDDGALVLDAETAAGTYSVVFTYAGEEVTAGDTTTVYERATVTQAVVINSTKSDDATLAFIVPNVGTLTPDVAAGVTAYKLTLPAGTTSYDLTVTANSTAAKLVQIVNNDGLVWHNPALAQGTGAGAVTATGISASYSQIVIQVQAENLVQLGAEDDWKVVSGNQLNYTIDVTVEGGGNGGDPTTPPPAPENTTGNTPGAIGPAPTAPAATPETPAATETVTPAATPEVVAVETIKAGDAVAAVNNDGSVTAGVNSNGTLNSASTVAALEKALEVAPADAEAVTIRLDEEVVGVSAAAIEKILEAAPEGVTVKLSATATDADGNVAGKITIPLTEGMSAVKTGIVEAPAADVAEVTEAGVDVVASFATEQELTFGTKATLSISAEALGVDESTFEACADFNGGKIVYILVKDANGNLFQVKGLFKNGKVSFRTTRAGTFMVMTSSIA